MFPQLEKLMLILKSWINQKKVGSVKVNFFKGGISNVELKESKKLDEE